MISIEPVTNLNKDGLPKYPTILGDKVSVQDQRIIKLANIIT